MAVDFRKCKFHMDTDEELQREAQWVEEHGEYIDSQLPPRKCDALERTIERIEMEEKR